MTLESLVEEIRRKGREELDGVERENAGEHARILEERDRRVAEVRAQAARASEAEVARERAQRVAAAKLAARKLVYEAREKRLATALEETRGLLGEFTSTAAYARVLERMLATATAALGRPVRVSGRAADAALLKRVAGSSFDPTPRPIAGGLIAETPDGARRLNLSFDELVRLREDRLRERLA